LQVQLIKFFVFLILLTMHNQDTLLNNHRKKDKLYLMNVNY